MAERPSASLDDLAGRMYHNEVSRHRKKAERALRDLRTKATNLETYLRGNELPTAVGAARNAASDLAELTEALSALQALTDVGFLVTEKEQP